MNSIYLENNVSLPKFNDSDISSLKYYFELNKRYYDKVNAELQTELAEHPVFGPLIKMQTPQQQKAQNERSHEMQRAAIFDGKWQEYAAELMTQGIMYARMNISYVDWYELIKLYKKLLIPHLKKDFPKSDDIISFLDGMTILIDYVMYALADAYFREKNNIIKTKEEQFRAIFENLADTILLIDKNLTINMINRVGVGLKKENFIGKSLLDVQMPDSYDTVKNAIDSVFKTKAPSTFETRYILDGLKKYYSSSVSPILGTDGEVENLVLTSRDISAKKRSENEIKEMNVTLESKVSERTEQLKKSNSELEQFAYSASHDLQEPLRSITNFSKLLSIKLEKYSDKEINEYMNTISGGAKRMSNLIFDLLNYSRIGKEMSKSEINFGKLLPEVLTELSASIEESGAEIHLEKLPTINAYEIKSVFLNLIGNAIKFRRKDVPCVINISASEKGKEIMFAIKDNGIGIEKEYYNRIFIIFQRLHTLVEYDGTGIGLSQCKKIIEQQGGKIWVESEFGKGSTFYFTLSKI